MTRVFYIISSSEIFYLGLRKVIEELDFKCIKIDNINDINGIKEDVYLIASFEYLSEIKISIQNKFNLIPFTFLRRNEISHNSPFISIWDSYTEIVDIINNDIKIKEIKNTDDLSSREIDVLKLVACGYSNKDIAEKLFISQHTVITHRKNITNKLGVKSISGLTVYAILNKIIDTDSINTGDLI